MDVHLEIGLHNFSLTQSFEIVHCIHVVNTTTIEIEPAIKYKLGWIIISSFYRNESRCSDLEFFITAAFGSPVVPEV